jgi:pantoate--beta-alanine ligase
MMILLKRAAAIHHFLREKRKEGNSIGFVPTMGALHEGHLSLVKRSSEECDITVCSIFVNPAQFNDRNDFEKYARPIESDIQLLLSVDCDVLFFPLADEIYPGGIDDLKTFDLGNLENFLEGKSRPGHFTGVANVIDRFFKIIEPDVMYLGQKDFQQVKVIERLISVTKLQKPRIVMCPIVREASGLAMSSRNVRLAAEQRTNATGISKELFFIKDHWKESDLETLQQQAINRLNTIPGARVDYLEFCDADNFRPVGNWTEAKHIVCVTAVKIGEVRLLDNVILN